MAEKVQPSRLGVREDRKIFGRNLRHARLERGMTQKDVAEYTTRTTTYISRVERGVCSTTIDNASLLAEAVGVPLKTLFDSDFAP